MSLPSIEQWRPVVGYEGLYEVSDHGRIRSLPREGARGGAKQLTPVRGGYLTVLLSRDGKQRSVPVHRVVGTAFLGPLPTGQQTRHLDGDPTNNTVGNLAYGTISENAADQVRHGTHHNAAKLECPHGHSYEDPANLIVYRGSRYCRTCQKTNRAFRSRRGATSVTCLDCATSVRQDGLVRHRKTCRGAE